MPKRETAIEFLTRLMEDDPVMQTFIIAAIYAYAQATLDVQEVEDTQLVSGEFWKQTAELVHRAVEMRLGSKEAGHDVH